MEKGVRELINVYLVCSFFILVLKVMYTYFHFPVQGYLERKSAKDLVCIALFDRNFPKWHDTLEAGLHD